MIGKRGYTNNSHILDVTSYSSGMMQSFLLSEHNERTPSNLVMWALNLPVLRLTSWGNIKIVTSVIVCTVVVIV